ncbi:helix-turn-helix domain-containing protein [Flammeovirga yaeyamensis]|uniref:Helix-turn-helix domain-containing protein n=1 Tax=Flammeovirga yaeyamensis TaxID=367791 RepID=A0AAX1N9U4_9BACT|nr:AraC family transcriptional regulator [Flammeovirga yaeyamensis]MBB3699375.1 AraC-like DNA-binding protein [Flammeovirga yaeyamensis]NMF35365.1 helix-turn-helix transcriptional regulator [Flammeovirga yaeyamensis]QWG04225.1 helix-turn-helix domain-containing protein [Flammeovirga yaeyamensis]
MKSKSNSNNILSGDEINPFSYFEVLKEKFGGSLKDDEYTLDHPEVGLVKSIFYQYLPDMYCGVTTLHLKKRFTFQNTTQSKNKFISLRIGKSGDFTSENKEKATFKNAMYLYNSQQNFSIDYPEDQNIRWYFVRFPVEVYYLFADEHDSKLKELINQDNAWFYYAPLSPALDEILQALDQCMEDEHSRRGMLLSKVIEIFVVLKNETIANNYKNIVYGVQAEDLNVMLKIKDDILNDFKRIPDVQKIAKEYGMSESKLQRTFKKVFKMPLLKYYNDQRQIEAKKLVMYSEKDLGQISFELGFTDLSHFSKRYTKYHGEQPSVTRKKSAENPLTF